MNDKNIILTIVITVLVTASLSCFLGAMYGYRDATNYCMRLTK